MKAIGRWWKTMGQPAYGDTTALLITADAGGSNGSRLRLWKWELQQLANRTGLEITVCHFPPGTSKWNRIEHRLFSHIAMNWRGTPLVSLAVIHPSGNSRGGTAGHGSFACFARDPLQSAEGRPLVVAGLSRAPS